MPPLPVLKPKELVRILEKHGYVQLRQKGSHLVLVRDGQRDQIVIPMHNKDIPKGTLRDIIRDLHLTVDEFVSLMK